MFGLSIANPLVLIVGVAGAAIPIIIHLIHRHRADVHRFAAIDLVLRTQKRLATRLKLHQLLLLLLRMAAIACIAFGLARPFLAKRAPAQGSRVPTSTVIVIDDSLSMQQRSGAGPAFDRALRVAKGIVAEMSVRDSAAVLTTSEGRAPARGELSFDKRALLAQLSRVKPGFGSVGPEAALAAACAALSESRLPRKRIVLLHDMARSAWPAAGLAALKAQMVKAGAVLEVVNAALDEAPDNAAVLGVEIKRSAAHRRDVLIAVRVQPGRERTRVRVVFGDAVAAEGFAEPARDAVAKQFRVSVQPGWPNVGRVRLPDDALAADNTRYFDVGFSRRVQALLIDGEPATAAYGSETFFLERALSPSRDADSLVQARVAPASALARLDLSAFDWLTICNVGDWPAQAAAAVRAYVEQGGRVFVTLGERSTGDALEAALRGLLPCGLRPAKSFEARPLRLDLDALDHPVAAAALGQKQSDAAEVRFTRIVPSDGRVAPGTEVVLRYSNGLPALLLRRQGKGAVALLTTSVDRDWTNLPIRTVFVPLMQELVRYMTDRSDRGDAGDTLVGEPRRLRLPKRIAQATVVGPDGEVEPLTLTDAAWHNTAAARRTPLPGVYTVKAAAPGDALADAETVATFVVNVDPKESDLARLKPKALEQALGMGMVAFASVGDDGSPAPAHRAEVSFAFLLAALAVLMVEALVAIRE